MPRYYIRKTNRERDENKIDAAVQEIINNKTPLRAAAQKYNIAKSTLNDYVKRYEQGKIGLASFNGAQIISDGLEKSLLDHLIISADISQGLTCKQIRHMVFEFAKMNNVKIPKSWYINGMAGREWYNSFLKRHNISINSLVSSVVCTDQDDSNKNISKNDVIFCPSENSVEDNAFSEQTQLRPKEKIQKYTTFYWKKGKDRNKQKLSFNLLHCGEGSSEGANEDATADNYNASFSGDEINDKDPLYVSLRDLQNKDDSGEVHSIANDSGTLVSRNSLSQSENLVDLHDLKNEDNQCSSRNSIANDLEASVSSNILSQARHQAGLHNLKNADNHSAANNGDNLDSSAIGNCLGASSSANSVSQSRNLVDLHDMKSKDNQSSFSKNGDNLYSSTIYDDLAAPISPNRLSQSGNLVSLHDLKNEDTQFSNSNNDDDLHSSAIADTLGAPVNSNILSQTENSIPDFSSFYSQRHLDECEIFGRHIVMQLNNLSSIQFVSAQEEIQRILTKYRLEALNQNTAQHNNKSMNHISSGNPSRRRKF